MQISNWAHNDTLLYAKQLQYSADGGESVDVDVGGGACTERWLQLWLPYYWQSGLQIMLEGNSPT